MTSYIHHTPGRLRVRSALIKRDAAAAERVRQVLISHPGVSAVDASPVTGSITIRYVPDQVEHRHLLSVLEGHGHLGPAAAAPAGPAALGERIGAKVGSMLLEKLVERSATALIAALI